MHLDQELADTGHWVCAGCRSINRRGRRTCYSCGASTPATLPPEPAADVMLATAPAPEPPQATVRFTPVSSSTGASSSVSASSSAASGLEATVADDAPGPQMVSRADPPITKSTRGARGRDGRATANTAATPPPVTSPPVTSPPVTSSAGTPPPAPEATVAILRRAKSAHPSSPIAEAAGPAGAAVAGPAGPADAGVREPAEADSAVAEAAVAEAAVTGPARMSPPAPAFERPPSVCPYLGIREDRTTRYDLPHPNNACHALHAEPPQSGWRAVLARRTGVGPRDVSPGHQAMLCLTASHEHCPRYQSSVHPPPPPASALWGDDRRKA